jgi:thermostable 8-oxoguanine DNA glycosylase
MARRRPLPKFVLQFDPSDISDIADRYSYDDARERRVTEEIGPTALRRGHFTRAEFLEVCRWKTPRSQRLVELNPATDIEQVTRLAVSATSEAVRIGVLRALQGVDWATASVFLHFGHQEPYPIIDFRALEALGVSRGSVIYSLALWLAYVRRCRELARQYDIDMRRLDRALWQWSKERSS